MEIQEITSAQNPKIKDTATLIEKSRERRSRKLFVVEGVRETAACIRNGYTIRSIFFNNGIVSPKQIEDLFPAGSAAKPGIFSVTPAAYSKIAYRENTEGIVAVVEEKQLKLQDIKFGKRWEHPRRLLTEKTVKDCTINVER